MIGSNNKVIIKKFTQNLTKDGKKDPKSGWSLQRDTLKGQSHGGSYWKLIGKDGKRKATLDKSGKILRD
ncbi:hypothetical protein [Brochothrix thermosphacta]|uniref:hypothetical protein n=1 Tax=Brochothrix thermosphacta TaxID=2756 RepID=UPI00241FDEBD|nr:hypothetical protein [Brochothrix thermosphacta]